MLDIRPLLESDLDAARELSRLAFGGPPADPTQPPPPPDDLRRWGGFDGSGRLVAKATDLEHAQWWGGRIVPACGVAGVAVEPEQRGRGATRGVMTALLRAARHRGAAVATLFCTSTAVYRSLGFEACGVLRQVDVPTMALPRSAPDDAVTVRRGDGADWADVRAVYDEVAATGAGLLSRRGGPFEEPTGARLPDGLDGLTLAYDDGGRPVGYLTWRRGRGYDDEAVLTVPDCLALGAEPARALLASLGSWTTVVSTIRLRPLPWIDAVAAQLPLERLREHWSNVWMHRPLDVVAAVAARGWPDAADTSVEFRLVDPLLPWNDGPWRLTVDAGSAVLEPAGHEPDLTLTVRGWSLLWCGAARAAQLRQAGFLSGGGHHGDAALDVTLGAGGRAGLLDYF